MGCYLDSIANERRPTRVRRLPRDVYTSSSVQSAGRKRLIRVSRCDLGEHGRVGTPSKDIASTITEVVDYATCQRVLDVKELDVIGGVTDERAEGGALLSAVPLERKGCDLRATCLQESIECTQFQCYLELCCLSKVDCKVSWRSRRWLLNLYAFLVLR